MFTSSVCIIKRCPHEWKYRGFYNKVQSTENIQEQERQIGLPEKNLKKSFPMFNNQVI